MQYFEALAMVQKRLARAKKSEAQAAKAGLVELKDKFGAERQFLERNQSMEVRKVMALDILKS